MPRDLPPLDFLSQCLRYEPETGRLFWLHRPVEHFPSEASANAWNAHYAGKEAMTANNGHGYRRGDITYNGVKRSVQAHRVAYYLATGEQPKYVDHINCDKSDNRLDNLRTATLTENNRNCRGRVGRDLPKGVYYHRRKFRALIRAGGYQQCLGFYDTAEDAHAAYVAAAIKYHGDFANFGGHGK